MTGIDSSESPLEAATGAVGPAAARAFELLGNETRLAILLALWDAYEPFAADDDALSFSELFERVDYDTSGNFSYHVEKLEGHFVESTDDGYRLRQAGHKIVRAVIAGAGITDTTLEPTEIDFGCTLCGESLAITYENEHLYTVCRECKGRFAGDIEKAAGDDHGALVRSGRPVEPHCGGDLRCDRVSGDGEVQHANGRSLSGLLRTGRPLSTRL